MKKKAKYDKTLPKRMYLYFCGYSEAGAPSFVKFAKSIGVTTEELQAYRRYPEFERSYRECNEIRRDYLIDSALTKRQDSSLVKFLLSCEFGMGDEKPKAEEQCLTVTLEVVE